MQPLASEEFLFSYGTLQREAIQMDVFGRLLAGVPDQLAGFKLSRLALNDRVDLDTTYYPVVVFTGSSKDIVSGTVYQLNSNELINADQYETQAYKRYKVSLVSKKTAWVYVATS